MYTLCRALNRPDNNDTELQDKFKIWKSIKTDKTEHYQSMEQVKKTAAIL